MKRRAVVMVAALALAGGACGGDDDGGATDDASATSDADNGEDEGSGGESGDSEWCELARDLDSSTLLDDIEIDDADSVEEAYDELVNVMDDAVDSAPDEIRDDVETVLASTKRLVEELEDVDFDVTAVDESTLFDADTTAAAERLDEYGQRVCGIGSDTDDTTLDLGDIGDTGGTGEIGGDTAREQMVSVFKLMGMTEEQANCVVDNIDLDELDDAANLDPSQYFELFEDCGFDLTNPGG